jgi:hypothetical protein
VKERLPAPVKRLVHAGSRGYGRLTAERRVLPSFLICGGQRCGTTSLYRALSAHPAILKAVLHKGVHFFDVDYARGLSWYRAHFPVRRRVEHIERVHGVAAHTFESSPYYMYHPHAVARIAADLPGVKVVVLVRDPVERAYSQHAHEVARGFEPERDFATALALEAERLRGAHDRLRADPYAYDFAHQHHAYTARGEYIEYLEPMASLLGRGRIHVMDSAEFFTAPRAAYDGVLRFLGLPKPTALGAAYPVFEQHNARPRSRLAPDLGAALATHYAPYDARLASWLGAAPSWMDGS